jgi:hypothetical protein
LLEGAALTFLYLLLLCLSPVAAYCVLLAYLNRRLQPTLVPGAWDFLGLLFAASGLLLFAGPRILNTLFKQAIDNTIYEEGGPSPASVDQLRTFWWCAWSAYYVLVLGGAAFLVWLRAGKTVIYNVGAADFERALEQALARLGLGVTRSGRHLFLAVAGAPVTQTESVPEPQLTAVSTAPLGAAPEMASPLPRASGGDALLDVEPFAALWTVTLHWRSQNGTVRQEVEDELVKELREVRTYDNTVGSWFLGIAGFLFALIFMILMVLILGPFLQQPPH